jgi:hypothetical protein
VRVAGEFDRGREHVTGRSPTALLRDEAKRREVCASTVYRGKGETTFGANFSDLRRRSNTHIRLPYTNSDPWQRICCCLRASGSSERRRYSVPCLEWLRRNSARICVGLYFTCGYVMLVVRPRMQRVCAHEKMALIVLLFFLQELRARGGLRNPRAFFVAGTREIVGNEIWCKWVQVSLALRIACCNIGLCGSTCRIYISRLLRLNSKKKRVSGIWTESWKRCVRR